ncbi:DUF2804 domain-containing protein [Sporosarcina sp. PTS2304]|uniref:DUF2804 domain-containing protein n=1 Tax=Sporosarcina sp. PTS2304 TaxID=2283194 RepID=UPI000E0CE1D7|nr:DUF2804 domain-containing protein [Sporosarcina sp. PTS2304]AXI01044.1 DUF2804 domain-containing protein [Sporosarcina sp. PTS2304]
MQHEEKQLHETVPLCDAKGLLNPESIGFSHNPLVVSNLKGQFMKKKRWNHWCIYGEDLLFSATIVHLDYKAICLIYILNYETQRFYEKYVSIPLGRRVHMPHEPLESVKFIHDEITLQIIYMQGETHLTVTIPDFDNERLHADLHIIHPEKDESLNVVVPRSRESFHYTSKHTILPTGGFVIVGDRRYDFNPYYSFAVYDFGRGVWTKMAKWEWAMASQRTSGKRVGLNLGGSWTDGTGLTENAVFVEGTMYKFHEDVLFTHSTDDLLSSWSVNTKFSDDISLVFKPFFQNQTLEHYFMRKMYVNQIVGYYHGKIRLPNGQILPIRQMLGSILERRYL